MSDIFDEIQEEAAEERWLNLWKKYQNHIYAVVALCVALTAGHVWWKRHQMSKAIEASEKYMGALQSMNGNHTKTALGFLEEIPLNYSGAYKDLSRFLVAAVLQQEGDDAGALDVYRQIVNDTGSNDLYKNLALLRLAYLGFDKEDPKSLIKNLEPLTKTSSPWKFSALELTALILMKEGDKAGAEKALKRLIAEAETNSKEKKEIPSFVTFRAESLMRSLENGDTTQKDLEKKEVSKKTVLKSEENSPGKKKSPKGKIG